MFNPAPAALAYKQLYDLLARPHNLQDVVNLGEKLLCTPVSFSNSAFRHRAISAHYPMEDIQAREAYFHANTAESYYEEVLYRMEQQKDSTPFILHAKNTARRYISKAYCNGKHVGHFTVPQGDFPLEKLSTEIIVMICNACAITYVLENSTKNMDDTLTPETALFESLFNLLPNSMDDFDQHARFYTFGRYSHFLMLCFVGAKVFSPDFKRLLTLIVQQHDMACWSLQYCGRLCLLLGMKNPGDEVSFFEALKVPLEKHDLHVGVSDRFTDLHCLRHHYNSAEETVLFFGLNRRDMRIHMFDRCKIAFFMRDIRQHVPDPYQYCSFTVHEILDYDRTHDTQYAETLKTYLLHRCSPQETASVLFLHKNTIIYRIKRLEELFGIDFTDGYQNFRMLFSFALLSMVNSIPPAPMK